MVIKFAMFFFLIFFIQKAENNRLKKANWPKFCNIIFLFLLKAGSAGPVEQQINAEVGTFKLIWVKFD